MARTPRGSDIVAILKGLSKVGSAAVEANSQEISKAWATSSIRPTIIKGSANLQEMVYKNLQQPQNLQTDMTKGASEALARMSMVTEGIKAYRQSSTYTADISSNVSEAYDPMFDPNIQELSVEDMMMHEAMSGHAELTKTAATEGGESAMDPLATAGEMTDIIAGNVGEVKDEVSKRIEGFEPLLDMSQVRRKDITDEQLEAIDEKISELQDVAFGHNLKIFKEVEQTKPTEEVLQDIVMEQEILRENVTETKAHKNEVSSNLSEASDPMYDSSTQELSLEDIIMQEALSGPIEFTKPATTEGGESTMDPLATAGEMTDIIAENVGEVKDEVSKRIEGFEPLLDMSQVRRKDITDEQLEAIDEKISELQDVAFGHNLKIFKEVEQTKPTEEVLQDIVMEQEILRENVTETKSPKRDNSGSTSEAFDPKYDPSIQELSVEDIMMHEAMSGHSELAKVATTEERESTVDPLVTAGEVTDTIAQGVDMVKEEVSKRIDGFEPLLDISQVKEKNITDDQLEAIDEKLSELQDVAFGHNLKIFKEVELIKPTEEILQDVIKEQDILKEYPKETGSHLLDKKDDHIQHITKDHENVTYTEESTKAVDPQSTSNKTNSQQELASQETISEQSDREADLDNTIAEVAKTVKLEDCQTSAVHDIDVEVQADFKASDVSSTLHTTSPNLNPDLSHPTTDTPTGSGSAIPVAVAVGATAATLSGASAAAVATAATSSIASGAAAAAAVTVHSKILEGQAASDAKEDHEVIKDEPNVSSQGKITASAATATFSEDIAETSVVEDVIPEADVAVANVTSADTTVAPALSVAASAVESASPAVDTTPRTVNIAASAVNTAAPVVNIATPEVDTAAPSVETASPAIDTALSAVDITTPAIDATTPEVDTTASSVETVTPTVDTAAPALEAATPVVDIAPPPVDTAALAVATAFPAVDTAPPAVTTAFPAVDTAPPAVDITTPAIDAPTPAVDTAASAVGTATPAVDITTPAIDATTPVVDTAASSVDAAAPAIEAATTAVGIAPPAVDTVAPAVATASPAVDTAPPAVDITTPAIDAPIPAIDTAAPAVDTVTPAVDITTPAIDAPTPAIDTAASAVDTVTPAVDITTPAIDATTLVVDTTTSSADTAAPAIEAATTAVDIAPPAVDTVAPAVATASPAVDITTPAIDAPTPAINTADSAVDTVTPAADTATPAIDYATPAIDTAAPAIDSIALAVDTATPAVDAASPAVNITTPVVDAATSVVDTTMSTVDAATPTADTIAPTVDVAASMADTASAVDAAVPAVDTATDAVTPVVDAATSAVDAASPAVGVSTPVVDAAAPAVDDVSPVVDTATPAVDSVASTIDSAPVADAVAPARDGATPPLNATATLVDTVDPAVTVSAPSSDAAIPVDHVAKPAEDAVSAAVSSTSVTAADDGVPVQDNASTTVNMDTAVAGATAAAAAATTMATAIPKTSSPKSSATPVTAAVSPSTDPLLKSSATALKPKAKPKLLGKKPLAKDKPKSTLAATAQARKVPHSRLGRMMSFGGLAAGLGAGTIAELTRRTLGVKKENNSESLLDGSPFLTEANAKRIVDTLCKVRGAALKLGQMLSIQDSAFINPQLQKIFERVRQSADFMPAWQLEKAIVEQLGSDWQSKVASFDDRPFAAASIGQVHQATLHDGRSVAMKIQYPGVAEGIESDINNLISTLKVTNIIPEGLYVDSVIEVAKRELGWECDYIREKQCTERYRALVKPYPEYYVPEIIDELCTQQVFTSELLDGIPVDKCVDLDQDTRNFISEKILRLCLLELFHFGFMQTDPNWSNFFYNAETEQLALLDFGACRTYKKDFVDKYIHIIHGAATKDREKIREYSQELGFLTGHEAKVMVNAHVDAVMILGEAFQEDRPFEFGSQDTTYRIQHLVPVMLSHRMCAPPEESYSLHRKMSGVFLLCAKLNGVVNCKPLFDEVFNSYKFGGTWEEFHARKL